jgi:hypothetical protein
MPLGYAAIKFQFCSRTGVTFPESVSGFVPHFNLCCEDSTNRSVIGKS